MHAGRPGKHVGAKADAAAHRVKSQCILFATKYAAGTATVFANGFDFPVQDDISLDGFLTFDIQLGRLGEASERIFSPHVMPSISQG